MRYGSCNAQTFAVHPGSTSPALVGHPSLSDYGTVNFWGRKNDYENILLLRSRIAGEQWGWCYLEQSFQPYIQVIRQADDTPLYIWEAENKVDPYRNTYKPIVETNDRGESIIPPGGSSVVVVFPESDIILSLETDLEAAAVPAWAEKSNFRHDSTANLMVDLWRADQARSHLECRNSIWQVYRRYHKAVEFNIYTLLWLRCVSRILYGHYGQTCIPLFLNKFKVDEYGFLYLA